MKNLLTITDLHKNELQEILDLSLKLEQNPKDILKGKNIIFAFEKPSLRTKVGTEVAINHLGGSVIHIDPKNFFEGNIVHAEAEAEEDEHLTGREALVDTVKNVNQWCDGIFARVYAHQTLKSLAQFAEIPVINALCDQHHPMQALADMLTIQQKLGKDKKVKVAFVGDGNNVAFSLIEILLKLGHEAHFAGPKKYFFSEKKIQYFENLAKESGGNALFTHIPTEAVKDVDTVYTDTFVSMGEEQEYNEKIQAFSDFQVNAELMNYAKPKAGFMHCLPAHRGIEVTDEVMDGQNAWIYQQAKNRMVTSKGVFAKLLNSQS